MSKLLELLKLELDELRESLRDEKSTKEESERIIKDEELVVRESEKKIMALNTAIAKASAKIEAVQEDAKAYKVAAQGFLKGVEDEETKLNFCALCETLGIEIEIEADENAAANEAPEEESEMGDTGT